MFVVKGIDAIFMKILKEINVCVLPLSYKIYRLSANCTV